VPQITDLELIQERLEKDRYWTAYAIADLEPEHFQNTTWFQAADGSGLTLLYRGFSMPLVFCIEGTLHLDSILDEIDDILGQQVRSITVSPAMASQIKDHYKISSVRILIRMALKKPCFCPVQEIYKTTLLTPTHLNLLKELYREDPPEFFLDRMIEEGIYYGIFEDNHLIAVAGTHVLSLNHGIGMLGNIYTRADKRNHGYASHVTGAVSRRLIDLGIDTIALNVVEENHAAIRVYERLGYRNCCETVELTASLNSLLIAEN